MEASVLSKEEVGRRAMELYDSRIRVNLAPECDGRIIALDIDSGDYELDETILAATRRLRKRRPDGTFFALRVGYDAVWSLGGSALRRTK